jgi:hypothetical protein
LELFLKKSCLELVKCEHQQAHRSENSLAYFFHGAFRKLNKISFFSRFYRDRKTQETHIPTGIDPNKTGRSSAGAR